MKAKRMHWLLVLSMSLTAAGFAQSVHAEASSAEAVRADIAETLGFVPDFFSGIPEHAIGGMWMLIKELEFNPDTALDGKTKHLIGLAVAAQVPCSYCIYGHLRAARAEGASEQEIGEAVAMAALIRFGSTMVNGLEVDLPRYQAEFDKLLVGE